MSYNNIMGYVNLAHNEDAKCLISDSLFESYILIFSTKEDNMAEVVSPGSSLCSECSFLSRDTGKTPWL